VLKGALHLHSMYSDGEFALADLRRIFVAAGCQFACITDHAESLDPATLSAYVQECDSLSDHIFRFVAGLEFECENRMHILGYGVTTPVNTKNPEEVICAIRALHGIAVIAHPQTEAFPWIESFDVLPDAIEAWNTKYDGQYAPRPETFRLIHRLRQRKPELLAFYGQDLHWQKQYRSLFIEVDCTNADPSQIFTALRSGRYKARKGKLVLPSDAAISDEMLARFSSRHRCSRWMRESVRRVKKVFDRLGIAVPLRWKAQLRRIF
jgi:predicted metal-dependent phosphoesterase TrpH